MSESVKIFVTIYWGSETVEAGGVLVLSDFEIGIGSRADESVGLFGSNFGRSRWTVNF